MKLKYHLPVRCLQNWCIFFYKAYMFSQTENKIETLKVIQIKRSHGNVNLIYNAIWYILNLVSATFCDWFNCDCNSVFSATNIPIVCICTWNKIKYCHHIQIRIAGTKHMTCGKKTDRHDITEILLKVALNTINQTKPFSFQLNLVLIGIGQLVSLS